jgi:hypothetical protein
VKLNKVKNGEAMPSLCGSSILQQSEKCTFHTEVLYNEVISTANDKESCDKMISELEVDKEGSCTGTI